ncbi:MAG: hypothetical protein HY779_02795 [Rubrobacteridae bacterium]|nr:hypothetical protein [Rubrobacteridae bacterium]
MKRKQQKISIKIAPTKQRKEWQINPVQRVHSDTEYNRNLVKQELKKDVSEHLQEE